MDDLTAFVTARLDEDEAAAKANIGTGPGWSNGLGDSEDGGVVWPDYQTFDSDELTTACDYLDRFRPLRMLREIAAKRRMVNDTWGGPDHEDMWLHHMHLLAAIWSGHPDYKPEWAPEGEPDGT